MPSQAPGWLPRIPRSSPSTAMDDSPPFRPNSVRRWKQCCSLALTAMAGVAGCHPMVPPATASPSLEWQARLLRVQDTRRDEPLFLDSLLDGSDASQRAAAALTVGRIGARAHLPRLRALAADADTSVAANALFALGLVKDTAAAALGATALRATPVVAVEAAWLLGELGERGRQAL